MIEQRTTRITKFRVVPWEDVLWPSDGLVSWWKLNGNANDAWGSNHGTAYGVVFLPKGAGSFDGVDDYIANGSSDYWKPVLVNGFSIEAWIKQESKEPVYAVIGFWGYHTGLVFGVSEGAAFFSNTTPASYATSYFGFSLEEWQHLVATYSAEENKLGLWINAELKQEKPVSGELSLITPFRIGYSGFSGQYYKGLIDEVRVYNRPLSADEIKKRYLKTKIAYLEVGV